MSVTRGAAMFLLLPAMLWAQQKSITGKVTRHDNSAITGLMVVVEQNGTAIGEHTTDALGNYAISLPAGTYDQLRVRNLDAAIDRIPRTVEYTVTRDLTIGADTVIDIKMPRYINIHGTVLSSTGDTIKNAQITAKRWLGYEQPPWDAATSDPSSGAYSLYQDTGSVKIWITPPAGSGVNNTSFVFSFNRDTLVDLILPAVVTMHGHVLSATGDTLKGIGVCVEVGPSEQIDSLTDNAGHYAIALNPGTYKVRLRNQGRDVAGVPQTMEETAIESLTISRDTLLDLRTAFYPAVRCSVVDVEGAPVADVNIQSKRWLGYEQPPWDNATSDAAGICLLYMAADSNKLWIEPPSGSDFISQTEIVRPTRDTTIAIVLIEGAVLSGTISLFDQSPVAGITVAIEKDADQLQTQTDAAGQYSIKLQPGTYRLRVRNTGMGMPISGIPQTLEYTVQDTMILSGPRRIDVTLPIFPVITGIVRDPAGTPVNGVQILAKRWLGYEQPPWAQYTTEADGRYTLTVGAGVNKVWVMPPASSPLGAFDFIEDFDTSKARDIYIAEKARGITRIQPSVISTGETGRVEITGINCNFSSGTTTLDLGAGITVSNVHSASAITLTADVTVAADAASGGRDVLVTVGATKLVGPSLLTITPPASADFVLDSQGKTTEDITIADGTGTELFIPAGTPIDLPPGADSTISFVAPIVTDASVNPTTAEFTDVQRELEPSGLVFGDTVVMTASYKSQDVVGMDESSLQPFYFTDATGGSSASVGDSMVILSRDTAANTVSFVMSHFSMFRLARKTPQIATRPSTTQSVATTALHPVASPVRPYTGFSLDIAPSQAKSLVTVSIYDLHGRLVQTLCSRVLGAGRHSIAWNGTRHSRLAASGFYIVKMTAGRVAAEQKFTFLR